MKPIKSPQLRTANCKVVSGEFILPLFVRMGDLCVYAWFGVIRNLAVDVVLGTSFIDSCIRGIFPSERKVVPRHSQPLEIMLAPKKIIAIAADTEGVDVHTKANRNSPAEEHYFVWHCVSSHDACPFPDSCAD